MNIQGFVFGLSMLLTAPWGGAVAEPPQLSGADLVAELTALYEATPSRCQNDEPAYRCSGFLVRGTRQKLPPGQGAWEPYPRGRTLNTSFTYVRRDIRLPRLAWHYSNGFIISAPTELPVRCFFPIDAVSDDRLDNGCGPNKDYRNTYSLCEVLPAKLLTMDKDSEAYRWTLGQLAQFWLDWDKEHADDLARRRCAYRLDDDNATQRFEIALLVAAQASQEDDKPNDFKIQTWNPGYDPRLPIRAFFYINEQGRPFAERDRDRFKEMTNLQLPLIKLTLLQEPKGKVAFEYIP